MKYQMVEEILYKIKKRIQYKMKYQIVEEETIVHSEVSDGGGKYTIKMEQ